MTDAFRRVAAVNIRKVYSNIKADRQLHLSILGAIGWFSGTIAFMTLRLLQSSSYETPFDGQQAPRHTRRSARVARYWRKDWKKYIFPCKVCILNFSESATCMEFWRQCFPNKNFLIYHSEHADQWNKSHNRSSLDT